MNSQREMQLLFFLNTPCYKICSPQFYKILEVKSKHYTFFKKLKVDFNY